MKHRRCNRTGRVIFTDELSAKLALAKRVWKDKGERSVIPCGNHYHLTRKRNPGTLPPLTSN